MGRNITEKEHFNEVHEYLLYIQKSFGDSSTTPANNKKSFGFLLKFLTDIVPFESAVVLKSHVLSPPAVPAKCRHLLADYVLLAKTRLQDLNVSLVCKSRTTWCGLHLHLETKRISRFRGMCRMGNKELRMLPRHNLLRFWLCNDFKEYFIKTPPVFVMVVYYRTVA